MNENPYIDVRLILPNGGRIIPQNPSDPDQVAAAIACAAHIREHWEEYLEKVREKFNELMDAEFYGKGT